MILAAVLFFTGSCVAAALCSFAQGWVVIGVLISLLAVVGLVLTSIVVWYGPLADAQVDEMDRMDGMDRRNGRSAK